MIRGRAVATTGPHGYPCQLVSDKDTRPPDPSADWWTTEDVAAYLGISPGSVRRYRARPREKGGLPPHERMFVRSPAWKPATIIQWNETERRGQGARTDLAGPSAG